jgi:hypothetical protein
MVEVMVLMLVVVMARLWLAAIGGGLGREVREKGSGCSGGPYHLVLAVSPGWLAAI